MPSDPSGLLVGEQQTGVALHSTLPLRLLPRRSVPPARACLQMPAPYSTMDAVPSSVCDISIPKRCSDPSNPRPVIVVCVSKRFT